MKILTAAVPAKPHDADYCEAAIGEICIPHGIVCTNPEKAAQCGCDRTHVGISSRQRTTTVLVAETDWSFDQLVAVARDHLIESNLSGVFSDEDLDDMAATLITQSVEVADDHQIGTRLRPRYDHEQHLWFYDEADR